MIEKFLPVPTKDGEMKTFIVHPDNDGPHPAVILFMDTGAFEKSSVVLPGASPQKGTMPSCRTFITDKAI